MPPKKDYSKAVQIPCIRCRRPFFTWDKRRNRMCDLCSDFARHTGATMGDDISTVQQNVTSTNRVGGKS